MVDGKRAVGPGGVREVGDGVGMHPPTPHLEAVVVVVRDGDMTGVGGGQRDRYVLVADVQKNDGFLVFTNNASNSCLCVNH